MFGWFKKKPKGPEGPDFSHLDSKEKVEAAFEAGELEKLYLMPLEYGGEDVPPNVLYVPVGVAERKHSIDVNVVGRALEEGNVSRYTANAEYQGDSFVPTAISIRAYDPGEFSVTINIWGDALEDE